MTRRRRQGGFSLLEVVVAVVILAAALGMLLGMLSRGLKQVTQSQGESEAAMYAQSLLDQVGTLENIVPGAREGDFADARYHWRLQIVPARDPAPPPPPEEGAPPPQAVQTDNAPVLYRVLLDVRWGEGPAQRLHFETLRLRAPSEAGAEAEGEAPVGPQAGGR